MLRGSILCADTIDTPRFSNGLAWKLDDHDQVRLQNIDTYNGQFRLSTHTQDTISTTAENE
jgi:hypothetical protein